MEYINLADVFLSIAFVIAFAVMAGIILSRADRTGDLRRWQKRGR